MNNEEWIPGFRSTLIEAKHAIDEESAIMIVSQFDPGCALDKYTIVKQAQLLYPKLFVNLDADDFTVNNLLEIIGSTVFTQEPFEDDDEDEVSDSSSSSYPQSEDEEEEYEEEESSSSSSDSGDSSSSSGSHGEKSSSNKRQRQLEEEPGHSHRAATILDQLVPHIRSLRSASEGVPLSSVHRSDIRRMCQIIQGRF